MEDQLDLARLLPDDVLADVLRRVAPRDLAASRCVSTAWRAVVDGRGLLRAARLPRSLAGLLVCYNDLPRPELFARPGTDPEDYFRVSRHVEDHCNGLLLHGDCVTNPATGGLLPLPERPPPRAGTMKPYFEYEYLAFDPAVSPDYEVFLVPSAPHLKLDSVVPQDTAALQSEWPPSPFGLTVMSSTTGRWEERRLVRQGEAAGTVADMQLDSEGIHRPRAACWHGALYVHQQTDFVMRISLSDHTYRVIKPPRGIETFKLKGRELHLGRSQKGVYYALLDYEYRFWAWILDESCGQTEWVLTHDGSHGLPLPSLYSDQQAHHGPYWILDNINCDEEDNIDVGRRRRRRRQVEIGWDSDDESIHHTEDRARTEHGDDAAYIGILGPHPDKDRDRNASFRIFGFHPYKEIVFLRGASWRGFAYHMKSSKLEDLGDLYPRNYRSKFDLRGYIVDAFPYTPCWLGEFHASYWISFRG